MPDHLDNRSARARPWETDPRERHAAERHTANNRQFPVDPSRYRRRMPARFRLTGAAVWLGIMLLAVIFYGYRYEIGTLGNRFVAILIPGHGYWTDAKTVSYFADESGQFWVDGVVNGVDFRFIVDTGATSIVFSKTASHRPQTAGCAMPRCGCGKLRSGPSWSAMCQPRSTTATCGTPCSAWSFSDA